MGTLGIDGLFSLSLLHEPDRPVQGPTTAHVDLSDFFSRSKFARVMKRSIRRILKILKGVKVGFPLSFPELVSAVRVNPQLTNHGVYLSSTNGQLH